MELLLTAYLLILAPIILATWWLAKRKPQSAISTGIWALLSGLVYAAIAVLYEGYATAMETLPRTMAPFLGLGICIVVGGVIWLRRRSWNLSLRWLSVSLLWFSVAAFLLLAVGYSV